MSTAILPEAQIAAGTALETRKNIILNRCDPIIEKLVDAIVSTNDTAYVKGEYFGYFVNRLVRSFLQTDDYGQPRFNSYNFSEPRRKVLNTLTDKLASYLDRGNPLSSAAELTYILLETYLHVAGKLNVTAQDNLRPYLRGMIISIREDIRTANLVGSGDREKNFMVRRYVITQGILDDVLAERGV